MNNRIALISANQYKEPYPVYPLGIAYLKSYLLKRLPMCQFDTLDMNIISIDQLIHYIKTNQPAAICISMRNIDCFCNTNKNRFFDYYKELIKTIKSATNRPIIIGGPAFSIYPEVFMQKLDVDYGIKGEGEELLYRTIEAIVNGSSCTYTQADRKSELYSKKTQPHCNSKWIDSPSVVFESNLVDYYWHNSGIMSLQT